MFKIFRPKKMIVPTLLLIIGALAATALTQLCTAVLAMGKGIKVPIIMYHSVLKDESQLGEYVISPVEVEKDIVFLKENGYTPITCQDLVSYVYSGAELPDKPVMLTFDDGCYNNMYYVLPILAQHNVKAVFSVVGSFCDKESESDDRNPNYSYMTWEDVKSAYTSGRVEIACHSDDFHSLGERRGSLIKSGESYADYRSVFMADTTSFLGKIKQNCEIVPYTYTYPYGLISEESKDLVKACGFKVSMGVEEKPNYITKNEECLYDLNRYNRPAGISTEEFMQKALRD